MNLSKQQLIAISLAICCAAVIPLQAEAKKKENKMSGTQAIVSSVPQPRSQKQVLVQNTPSDSRRMTTPNQARVQVRPVAAASQLTAKEAKKAAKQKEKEELEKKYKELFAEKNFGFKRLMKAFPDMTSREQNESLQKYKKYFNIRRNKNDQNS